MSATWFLIFFFVSLALFLSGFSGFAYWGLGLPVMLFLLWSLEAGKYSQVLVGVLAGLIIDSYSALPFGMHIALFLFLAVFSYAVKRFLLRRYFWGDAALVVLGSLLGALVFALGAWGLAGYHAGFWRFTRQLLIVFVTMIPLALLLIWHGYRKRETHGSHYVV
ncbi:MAG: hypothetical protein HYT40_03295 [Candidatus Sungbacteria bacterium]|uniref:Rod shape-determining protein MreD n=1 Tax=Candidatus Sungiibacteriota bacterium TaxID=2750080 RepID=A0A931SDL9_9BACT|nr:hypothetical protein [Candidatus Sungbacteria bacterium]